jgi:site-specific recombinase XerD
MAFLHKPTKTIYVTPEGKTVPKGTAGAVKTTTKAKRWYGRYTDERGKVRNVALSTDRRAAFQMLSEIEKKVEKRKSGLQSAVDDESLRPIADLVEEFFAHLKAKGNVEDHNARMKTRLDNIVKGCKLDVLADLDAAKFVGWLETFAATESLSQSTKNAYRVVAKSFVRWAIRSGKLAKDPLATVQANQKVTVKSIIRRALDDAEMAALLKTTLESKTSFRGLNGVQRHGLYVVALATGFRVKVLKWLRPGDFDLDSPEPNVSMATQLDKSKRGKVQPLPSEVVPLLQEFFRGKDPNERVWQGLDWKKYAAEMLRRDAEAAGIAVEVETIEGVSRLDFHTLRHSYITSLGRKGVELRTAQLLAGHSSPTITAKYSHRNLSDLSSAVNKLNIATPASDQGEKDVPQDVLSSDNSTLSGATPCETDRDSSDEGGVGKPQELPRFATDCNAVLSGAKDVEEREKVEQKRFELSTYALRTRRSPN